MVSLKVLKTPCASSCLCLPRRVRALTTHRPSHARATHLQALTDCKQRIEDEMRATLAKLDDQKAAAADWLKSQSAWTRCAVLPATRRAAVREGGNGARRKVANVTHAKAQRQARRNAAVPGACTGLSRTPQQPRMRTVAGRARCARMTLCQRMRGGGAGGGAAGNGGGRAGGGRTRATGTGRHPRRRCYRWGDCPCSTRNARAHGVAASRSQLEHGGTPCVQRFQRPFG